MGFMPLKYKMIVDLKNKGNKGRCQEGIRCHHSKEHEWTILKGVRGFLSALLAYPPLPPFKRKAIRPCQCQWFLLYARVNGCG